MDLFKMGGSALFALSSGMGVEGGRAVCAQKNHLIS